MKGRRKVTTGNVSEVQEKSPPVLSCCRRPDSRESSQIVHRPGRRWQLESDQESVSRGQIPLATRLHVLVFETLRRF